MPTTKRRIAVNLETPVAAVVSSLLDDLGALEHDPTMLDLVRRQPFFRDGLELVDGPQCPLCDTSWDVDALRGHLREKLARSVGAQQARDRILKAGAALVAAATQLRATFAFVTKLPETDPEFSAQLQQWSARLSAFAEGLKSFDGIVLSTEQLRQGWSVPPSGLLANLEAVRSRVRARPDKSATAEARSFITVAQDRLNSYRIARREHEDRKANAARGRLLYKTYCDVAEAELAKLYAEVEQEFGAFYRLLNEGDEAAFKAELTPAEGTLGLLVDFHEKGMYPPGAYHSEGHQDGMGVCLYLALMKRVLGSKFTFAVLDDVVMSVDRDHRKQFCKLLKTTFPDVQFIITTHDQVWARQIRSEGLVGSKAAVAFHHWTVETGPVLDEIAEVWDQIDADLARHDVPNAAARLRRHMEYVAADLAHELGAKVRFKADGGYDMGELLSAVIGRQKELLKDAARAAQSWDDDDQRKMVASLQAERASILAEKGGEEWVINKALHYNEWADFSKNDFMPVVSAFRRLIEQFRCPKPKCDSWLSLTPRMDPVDLRCACGATRINLRAKTD